MNVVHTHIYKQNTHTKLYRWMNLLKVLWHKTPTLTFCYSSPSWLLGKLIGGVRWCEQRLYGSTKDVTKLWTQASNNQQDSLYTVRSEWVKHHRQSREENSLEGNSVAWERARLEKGTSELSEIGDDWWVVGINIQDRSPTMDSEKKCQETEEGNYGRVVTLKGQSLYWVSR